MKIQNVEFICSATAPEHYPKESLPEFVIIGKSNVGKSSLINTLCNRKKLAKTSSTPGKTRLVNFFKVHTGALAFYLVDLPGYGYAKVAKSEKGVFKRISEAYFKSRITSGEDTESPLRATLLLLDARRDAGESEKEIYSFVESLGTPSITVFTKSDKLSRGALIGRVNKLKKSLAINDYIAFSSKSGGGKAELLKAISERLLEQED